MKERNEDPNVLNDSKCLTVAKAFLAERYTDENGVLTLRYHRNEWYEYENGCWRRREASDYTKVEVLNFCADKSVIKPAKGGGTVVVPYMPREAKAKDIAYSIGVLCRIPDDINAPVWLDGYEDANPTDFIAFANGILDIEAYIRGEYKLIKPTPSFFTLNRISHDFDPALTSSVWTDYLDDILNKDQEQIDLLAEWFGCNLTCDTSFKKLMLLVGPTQSGKSTLMGVLRSMLAGGNVAPINMCHFSDKFSCWSLLDRSAAFDAHIPEGDIARVRHGVDRMLQIVNEDTIDVRGKYRETVSTRLRTRFTLHVSNFSLAFDHDNANAFEPATLILKLPNSYAGRQDRKLKPRLNAEAKNIIPWALEGLKRLRLNGKFTEPESSKDDRHDLRLITVPIFAFVEDWVILDDDAAVQQNIIHNAWKKWNRQQDIRKASDMAEFIRQLSNLYPQLRIVGSEIRGLKLTDAAVSKIFKAGKRGSDDRK